MPLVVLQQIRLYLKTSCRDVLLQGALIDSLKSPIQRVVRGQFEW